MIPVIIETFDVLFLAGALATFLIKCPDRRFSTTVIIYIFAVLHLAWVYFYGYYNITHPAIRLVFFSEMVFCAVWIIMIDCLFHWMAGETTHRPVLFWIALICGFALGAFFVVWPSEDAMAVIQGNMVFLSYGTILVPGGLMLSAMIFGAWWLESFWRSLSPKQRREYKALVVGSFLVCASLGWTSSYRLTYLNIQPNHFLLLWALLGLSKNSLFRPIFFVEKLAPLSLSTCSFLSSSRGPIEKLWTTPQKRTIMRKNIRKEDRF